MGTIKLGLNGATVFHADIKQCLEVAATVGFAYYEPREPQLKTVNNKTVLDLLTSLNLQWLPLNALENIFEVEISEAEAFFSLAKKFAIEKVIFVPGSINKRLSLLEATKKLRHLKSLAQKFSIIPLYEMIGFNTHPFNTLAEAKVIAEEVQIPLVLDTFHLAISRIGFKEMTDISVNLIGLVHLSDALGKELDNMKDENRVLPGKGRLPLVEILKIIRELGYGGPISVEVFHPQYYAKNPLDVAKEAFETSLNILARAGWLV